MILPESHGFFGGIPIGLVPHAVEPLIGTLHQED